jgi:hypothetical protein
MTRWPAALRRLMMAALLAAVAAAVCPLRAQESDPLAGLRAGIDAAARQMDSDLAGAIEALDRLAGESIALRKTRALTPAEQALHRRVFLLRGRANIQMLENDKAESSFREMLRVDPVSLTGLAPREQQMCESLRRKEGGVILVGNAERGAHVLLDGLEVGTIGDAPIRLAVLAGTYEIRLEKPAFSSASTRVTVAIGQTIAVSEPAMQRRVPPLILLASHDDVEVTADHVSLGRTAKLAQLRAQLSEDEKAALDRILAAGRFDAQTVAGVVVRQPALDRAMTVRFHRECFVEETRSIAVPGDLATRTGATDALVWPGDAAFAAMQPALGTLRVVSTPTGADVFLDGKPAGRTPFERDVCAGTHRIRVRHRIGSADALGTIALGRTETIDLAIKPEIAFLGAVDAGAARPAVSPELTARIERLLSPALTAYHVGSRLDLPADARPWADASTVELVVAAGRSDRDAVTTLLKQAVTSYEAPLLLVAVRRPAGSGSALDLLLFSSDGPGVDRLAVPDASDGAIAAALRAINTPADPLDLVYRTDIGVRAADTSMPDVPLLVVAVAAGSSAAAAGVKAGEAILAVDRAHATSAQLAERVAQKQPGEMVTLTLASPGGTKRDVAVAVQRRPRRAPAFDPNVAGNALILRLTARALTAPPADRDLLIFGAALAHMRFGAWPRAAELLASLPALPAGDGVGPAAAKYFLARCREETGEKDRAIALYKEIATADDQPMADDGTTVGALARYRLALLGAVASQG